MSQSPDTPTCRAVHHGTTYAYKHYGCRCPEALERVRRKNRRQQQRGAHHAGPRSRSTVIDEIAVERACHGDPVTLTVRERAAAVALMTARGLSAREIGRRLGLASRTVHRYRMGVQLYGKVA